MAKEIQLLDLPEEVMRHIFAFLPDNELHFNVRSVCRQLQNHVRNYVQLG